MGLFQLFSMCYKFEAGISSFPIAFHYGHESSLIILSRVKEGGFLSGFSIGGRGGDVMEVSYLLFPNNMLILYDTSNEHIRHLSLVLM